MSRLAPLVLLVMLASVTAAEAKTRFGGLHPHRGGSLRDMRPFQHENSLEAFRTAHALGAGVIELDVKLTQDNVPVVMHDQRLDRTTNCTGPVRARSAADLAANCRIDTLGIGPAVQQIEGGVPVPPLTDVLAWAKAEDVLLNLEIKNQPTDNDDFDVTAGFAQTVLNTIEASGIPKANVLIQSFWPTNLDAAKLAGFQTAYLTLASVNRQGISFAKGKGYDVLSPGWPIEDPEGYMREAREAGFPVIPYTLNTREDILLAIKLGMDGVITDDLHLGVRTLYGERCETFSAQLKRATRKFLAAKRARRRADTPRERRRASRRVRVAAKAMRKARRARNDACERVEQLN